MTIKEIQDEIVEEFEFLDDGDSKLQYVLDLAKELEPYPETSRTEAFMVKGCLSKVWLYPYPQEGRLYFKADSEGQIAKGMIALLLQVYSGQKPEDIVKEDIYFVEKIGLRHLLTPGRSNGLSNMIKKIESLATAMVVK